MTEFPRIEEEIKDLKNILRRSNLTEKGQQLLKEYEFVLSKVKNLALSGVGNWVTFENNPPSEDGRYLLKQNEAVYIADYYKESDIWQDDHYNRITGVDYWMHLPE